MVGYLTDTQPFLFALFRLCMALICTYIDGIDEKLTHLFKAYMRKHILGIIQK